MPANYFYTQAAYNWIELAGDAAATLIVGSGNHWANPFDLAGHTFTHYGTVYSGSTAVMCSMSGLVSLGPGGWYNGNVNGDMIHNPGYPSPGYGNPLPAICPLWNDYYGNNPPNNSLIGKIVAGGTNGLPAGNSWLVIEWNGVMMLPSDLNLISFEVQMQLDTSPNNGDLIFQYKQLHPTLGPSAASIGLTTGAASGGTATNYNVSSYNQANPLAANGQAMLWRYSSTGLPPGGAAVPTLIAAVQGAQPSSGGF